jgi:acetyltransferase-like isoleucine patch superfamily enzyme
MGRKMRIDTNIIPETVRVYGNVQFGKECIVGEYTIIGYPCVESRKSFKPRNKKTSIGSKCIIGNYVVIYEGAKIGDGTRIEDFCRIGENVIVGKNCYILYGAKIYGDAKIGNRCKIAGFCCERAKIGNKTRVFGELIHAHRDPSLGWDDVIEKSPSIEDDVFIGFGVKVIGGIKIGKNSYIKAGAIVTKDVPSKSVVLRINEISPYKKSGGKVKNSKFFRKLK